MTSETLEALTKVAKNDLATARRRGELVLAGTKKGTVFVRHANGAYSLTRAPRLALGETEAEELVAGAPRFVVPVLASLYEVEHA